MTIINNSLRSLSADGERTKKKKKKKNHSPGTELKRARGTNS